jgi:hypothetical protein
MLCVVIGRCLLLRNDITRISVAVQPWDSIYHGGGWVWVWVDGCEGGVGGRKGGGTSIRRLCCQLTSG